MTGIMPIGIYVGLFVRMMLAFIVDITRGNDTEVAEHTTAALAVLAQHPCIRCMRPVTLAPKTWAHPVPIQGTILVTR